MSIILLKIFIYNYKVIIQAVFCLLIGQKYHMTLYLYKYNNRLIQRKQSTFYFYKSANYKL